MIVTKTNNGYIITPEPQDTNESIFIKAMSLYLEGLKNEQK